MFCDLNLAYPMVDRRPVEDRAALAQAEGLVQQAYDLGYQVVAFSQIVTSPINLRNIAPIKTFTLARSGQPSARHDRGATPLMLGKAFTHRSADVTSIYQLRRITVVADKPGIPSKATFANPLTDHYFIPVSPHRPPSKDMVALNKLDYDIVAVQPLDNASFDWVCENAEVDIITFNLAERHEIRLKHTTVGVAVSRGVHFELNYGDCLRNSTARRQLLNWGHDLFRLTGGKNLIFSSNATRALELRGPYDVMNLGNLFEQSMSVMKSGLTTGPRSVLYHAETRRYTHKSAVMAVSENPTIPGENQGADDATAKRGPAGITHGKGKKARVG
ncbi:RNA-binding RNA processing protein rpp1 [Tieghemiomyces parasiticus]|uniref:RNA-binding RNA processing protein rpp1 n=1 Tax=Tieghemiomyces parasiticus TaxID=78921 RepID=A0A9W8DWJ3_9FUNG|nr:RNA-binding RNA processing protein rpp1 [Tieghemiomyces parasiticus]